MNGYLMKKLLALLIILALLVGCTKTAIDPKTIANKLELAVKYLSENKYEEAILAYQDIIKIDKKNTAAYKGLSLIYTLQGKRDQAEQILQESLKQVTDNKMLQLTLAGLYADMGKGDLAQNLYQGVLHQDHAYLPAYQAYMQFLLKQGKSADAVALLEKAASDFPKQYKMYTLLTELYLQQRDGDKALAAVEKALALEPNQFAAYQVLEQIYQDKWSDLMALGEKLTTQNPVVGETIQLFGLYRQGKYAEVLQLYLALSDEAKNRPTTLLLAAQSHLKLGEKDQAAELLKQVKSADLKDSALLAELAWTFLETGEVDTARKLANQGISLDETNLACYMVLYDSYLKDNKDQAEIWKIKYLLSSPVSIASAQQEQQEYVRPAQKEPIQIPEEPKEIEQPKPPVKEQPKPAPAKPVKPEEKPQPPPAANNPPPEAPKQSTNISPAQAAQITFQSMKKQATYVVYDHDPDYYWVNGFMGYSLALKCHTMGVGGCFVNKHTGEVLSAESKHLDENIFQRPLAEFDFGV